MSCLNSFKTLLPARKAWRVFTNKVQTKLHKLHPPKTIKKPRNKLIKKTDKKTSCWPAIFGIIQRKGFKRKSSQSKTSSSCYVHKRSSPVYIDQLFTETAVSLVREHFHFQPPNRRAAATTSPSKEYKDDIRPSSVLINMKKPDDLVDDPQESMAGTSKEDGKMDAADDMWESLVLASPQMNGINQRAEEFITRFRADMLLQERLAHHL